LFARAQTYDRVSATNLLEANWRPWPVDDFLPKCDDYFDKPTVYLSRFAPMLQPDGLMFGHLKASACGGFV
jgi:hypothetical protein